MKPSTGALEHFRRWSANGSYIGSHPALKEVKLFGSRAKRTQSPHSDVDLALVGNVSALHAEAVAAELDELPLPYRYDVKAFGEITFAALREHIERVGISIYP